ncbi:MAG: alanine--tRNA ligase-related protein [Dialister sp.]|nr:alanine--tRNA ligase-related protein [Dialister sp.]
MDIQALFYQDPYIKEFDAVVLSCAKGKGGYEIILSRTAFYPEGGGQPADHGTLNNVAVIDVKEREGRIIHRTNEPIPEGTAVRGMIDWARRFDFMQNHSGEHIFSGLVHKLFGYDNVGFHMNEETVLIDFNGPMTWDGALDIEKQANDLIYENKECRIFYPSEEELASMDFRSKKELHGTVRIVEFPEGDLCACCGTHVKRSGEIGMIKVISLVNHRGGVRLELRCGRRALLDYGTLTENNRDLARLLSARPYETKVAVERILSDEAALKERIARINQKYFFLRAASMEKREGLVIFREDEMNPYEIRKFCEYLIDTAGYPLVAVLSVKDEVSWNYVIGSSGEDIRPKLKEWNALLSGRGGGKPELVQGSFSASFEAIEKALTHA